MSEPDPPSGLESIPLGGSTTAIWPYTGGDFDTVGDPINVIFTGDASPANIRNALLASGGRREPPFDAFGDPWSDAVGRLQTGYADGAGWTGSALQMQCGAFQTLRFHVRVLPVGEFALASTHLEVRIPGTVEHQVVSWEFAAAFVEAELARSGFLTGPATSTPQISPTPTWGEIPEVIYNGLPASLRTISKGPPGGTKAPVGIPSSGRATILDLKTAPAQGGNQVAFDIDFDQVIPKAFCNSPGEMILARGPFRFHKTITPVKGGGIESATTVDADLDIWPAGSPPGAQPWKATVADRYAVVAGGAVSLSSSSIQRLVLAPGKEQSLEETLKLRWKGQSAHTSRSSC